MAEKDNNIAENQENTSPVQEADDKKAKKSKASAAKGKEAKVASLEEKLADAEKKQTEIQDTLLRTAAEYENFRRRSKAEHEAAFGNGASKAVLELLPVLDTLDAAANAPTTDEEYKKGVLLTLQKAGEVFAKLGVEEIPAMGQPFDPEVHNACMQEEAEGAESGTITRVVMKGYRMGERIVRHAMVAVAP